MEEQSTVVGAFGGGEDELFFVTLLARSKRSACSSRQRNGKQLGWGDFSRSPHVAKPTKLHAVEKGRDPLREEICNCPGIDIFHEMRMVWRKQITYLLHLLIPGETHCEDMMSAARLL